MNNFDSDFANDISDKNVFVFESHSVNNIDDINDKNVFNFNFFTGTILNNFVNKPPKPKQKQMRSIKMSITRTKLIENKSVVLSGVYLQPFCSTFFTFFTLFSIFNFNFLRERKKTRQPSSRETLHLIIYT